MMDTRKKALLTAAAAAALLPLPALADTGLYIGGSVGSAEINEDFGGLTLDSDNTAYRLVAGFQLSEFLSIEGGYQDFGRFEETFSAGGEPVRLRLRADGFTLGGTASLPLSHSLSLYGRAGAFFWDADGEINGIADGSADDTNPYYGAGGKVSLTERIDLIGDWTRYELDESDSDVISLGITIRF